jgi:photosystem II stability/assembly factor-like uncharacterized protein
MRVSKAGKKPSETAKKSEVARTKEKKSGDIRRRDRPEAGADEEAQEIENFRQRAEWFRQYHGDASGFIPSERRIQAIDHASRMERDTLSDLDPAGPPPKNGFDLTGERKIRAKLYAVKNPRPQSSFGFASRAVEISEPENLAGTVLRIALDKAATARVVPATVRVFVFDDETREWQLVVRSGASVSSQYAWARPHRPGIYVAVGLPADPLVLSSVLAVQNYMPWLRAARETNELPRILESIRSIIFSEPMTRQMLGGEHPPFGSGAGELGGFLLHLDLPMRGLPEFDILDDIFPLSMLGHRRQLEIARLLGRKRFWEPLLDWGRVFVRDWVSAGPRNVNGRIKCLAIHPADSNTVYAGAADGGVWVTNNGGLTWRPLMQLELSMAIGAIGISESSPQVLYAATGEDAPGWAPSYAGVGVYKTTDGGNTWNLLAPISSARCTRVLVHPANPDIVYVAGEAGMHRSTNGGASWTSVRTDHVSDTSLDPYTPDTIYAAVWNSGIFRSTDGGSSWSDYSSGLPTGSSAEWIKLAVGRDGPSDTSYLVAKMGRDSAELYKSHRLRRFIAPGAPLWSRIAGTHQGVGYNEWTNLVALDPGNHNVIFAGAVGLDRSSNGGSTFTSVGGTHSDHHAIVFDRNNTNVCYLATDGGVYRSTDNGVTWTLRSTDLTATQLYSIGVSQTAPFVLGCATQDQGIIKTGGSLDWIDTHAGNEGGFFIVDPNNSNNIYATPREPGGLRRSTDGGANWTTLQTGPQIAGQRPAPIPIAHLAVKPGDSNILIGGGGNQILKSTDQGNHWFPVGSSIIGSPTRVFFHPDGVTCYVTTEDGRVYRNQTGGTSGPWREPCAAANKPPTGKISAIEARTAGRFLPISHLIYITYPAFGVGHVYKSTDSGAHWTNASGSGAGALPDIPVNALVIDQYSGDTVYIATDIGVFITSDGGSSWQPFFPDSLPRVMITGLVLQKSTNTLYVSTMGRGAYRRSL